MPPTTLNSEEPFHRLVTACLRLSGISKTLVYQSKHGVLPPLPPNF